MRRFLALVLLLGPALLGLEGCATRHSPGPAATAYTPRATTYTPRSQGYGWTGDCDQPSNARQAANINSASIDTLAVSPFGHTEIGWRTYAPLTALEVGVRCQPDTAGFAEALGRWKSAHGLAYDGAMDDRTLSLLKGAWQEKRPFLMGRVRKEPCPPAPALESLEQIRPGESHYGRPILVRPEVLAAYRSMAAAARHDLPELSDNPVLMTIFSGYRSPEYDAAMCGANGGCNGVARAGSCSAHRTGAALDIVIGNAPGARVDTATDANRRYLSRTRLYQWMVWNAGHFGFVNYPYEPWHWEYVGQPGYSSTSPQPARLTAR